MPRKATSLRARVPRLTSRSGSKGPRPIPTSPFTTHEKAVVMRLVRVLREPDYWVGAFIEWLLQADATGDPERGMSTHEAIEKLTDLRSIISSLDQLKSTKDGALLRFLGHRRFPDRIDNLNGDVRSAMGADQDEAFGELVRMWRLEHPEPPKRIQHPTGHLGREESGD